ncbi:hypothetical protein Q8A67_024429 [Cirrhinus molitorella]|uniref:Uncharacterized protein n=1 Tax=Cirrhinus molitorella TaxID=172907 RepID=A0AA88NYG2_9TELE|nr:hypothetical protein Q8A67_024429 [Cirrhinus molitorella]
MPSPSAPKTSESEQREALAVRRKTERWKCQLSDPFPLQHCPNKSSGLGGLSDTLKNQNGHHASLNLLQTGQRQG